MTIPTRILHLLACGAMLCLHILAHAEVPPATAEMLMRKSGTWAQMEDMAEHAKAGILQSPSIAALNPQDLQRLQQAADEAFAAPRLRDTVLQVVASQMTPAYSTQALKWYGSPVGAMITDLEASLSSFEDMNQVLTEGNKVLARASGKRQALLSQTVQVTRVAQTMVSAEINSSVAMLQGIANVTPDGQNPPVEVLRSQLEAQRPQMEAAAIGVSLSMFALTYQKASDKALQQYITFLSSKSGAAFTAIIADALDQSLTAAARRFGSGIPKSAGTTSL